MEPIFVIRRKTDGLFATGTLLEYSPNWDEAIVYTKLESEVMFLWSDEEWFEIAYTQAECEA